MCHKETAEGGLEFFLGVSTEREKTTNIQNPRAGNTCEFEEQSKRLVEGHMRKRVVVGCGASKRSCYICVTDHLDVTG